MEDKNKYIINPVTLIRIGLGGVFIYSGVSSLTVPDRWAGFIPGWMGSFVSDKTFIMVHGSFEVIIGALLLSGFFLSITSFLAFLSLLSIMVFIGIDDITFRDFGLGMAALALFVMTVRYNPD